MSRWLLVAAATVALGACAREPTVIAVEVNVDSTVPSLLLLQSTVARASNPADFSSGAFRSLGEGDAIDRPAPFTFPTYFPVSVDPSLVGPVIVRFDGIDWDTHAVVATGSTPAEAVAGQRTLATLVLTATPAGADGGAPDGGN